MRTRCGSVSSSCSTARSLSYGGRPRSGIGKAYHAGFIRFPRAVRWEEREAQGALGEFLIEKDEERVLPDVDEERCSGCGSCRMHALRAP